MYTLYVDKESLEDFPTEVQKEVMKNWFLEHYEDPVHRTPYNSAEGGYLYIHGGPYETLEELEAEFGSDIEFSVIKATAQEIEDENSCYEWTINETKDMDRYEDDFYESDAALSSTLSADDIINQLDALRKLISVAGSNPTDVKSVQLRMIYSQSISCLEAFLSDYFLGAGLDKEFSLCKSDGYASPSEPLARKYSA